MSFEYGEYLVYNNIVVIDSGRSEEFVMFNIRDVIAISINLFELGNRYAVFLNGGIVRKFNDRDIYNYLEWYLQNK